MQILVTHHRQMSKSCPASIQTSCISCGSSIFQDFPTTLRSLDGARSKSSSLRGIPEFVRKQRMFPDTETGSPQPMSVSTEVLPVHRNVRQAVSCAASISKRCIFPREGEREPCCMPLAASSSTYRRLMDLDMISYTHLHVWPQNVIGSIR
jgi:hypothetical protein